MTLATRCPACGTVFRVVQDQLRVSDGWVRCGRCTEVFNAVEHFVDAATAGLGAPTAGEPPVAGHERPVHGERAAESAASSASAASATSAAAYDDERRLRDAYPPMPPQTDADLVPAIATDTDADADADADADGEARRDRLGDVLGQDPDGTRTHDMAADPGDRFVAPPPAAARRVAGDGPRDHPMAAAMPRASASATLPATALPMSAQPLPSFLRQADRAARWRQPRVRTALAAGCVLAALLLLAQAAHTWRDLLAVRWPALQPPLAQGCALLGCTLQPPRRIDAWVVDSSALLRVDRAPGAGLYRLSVSLHHRAAHAVALPALDLTLTDTQGRVIARRVLQPSDLADAPPALDAGTDWTAHATLQAAGGAVAGYTIELFYP